MRRTEVLVPAGSSSHDIQSAINDVAPGGTVRLAPGVFELDEPIDPLDGVALLGDEGGGTTLKLRPGVMSDLIANGRRPRHGVRIGHLVIDGSAVAIEDTPSNRDLGPCGVVIRRAKELVIHDIVIPAAAHTGVHIADSNDTLLERFRSTGTGWSGISVARCDGIEIREAVVADGGWHGGHSGIHVGSTSNVAIEAEVTNFTGNAIMFDSPLRPCRNITVRGSGHTSRRGMAIISSADIPVEHVSISGSCCDNREAGVFLSNTNHVEVTDCTIERNPVGVLLRGKDGSNDCVVERCTFRENEDDLQELHASKRNRFRDNTFH